MDRWATRTSGLIYGTTPPCEITTSPKSLFNLKAEKPWSARVRQKQRKQAGTERSMRNVLFVVPDRELQMPGHDTLLLVVSCRVARELEDLRSEVLKYSREVNCASACQLCAHVIWDMD